VVSIASENLGRVVLGVVGIEKEKRTKQVISEQQSLFICDVDNFVLLKYFYVMLQLFHL